MPNIGYDFAALSGSIWTMMGKNWSKMLGLCSLIFVSALSCKVEEKLPALGDRLAGAVDVVTSPNEKYFYVLNSDYERRYDKGSILIIDPEAAVGHQKLKAIPAPRMGRSLYVSKTQKLMIATYADPEAKAAGKVEIWDLADEANPVMLANADVNCLPLNAIIAPTQPYFAVSCVGGFLYMGKNPRNAAGAAMTLDLVRSYGYDRRALYFHEGAGKTYLFGFSTDMNSQDYADETLEDSQTYDPTKDGVDGATGLVPGSNGVPDQFENTPSSRRRYAASNPFHMFVYPVTDEEAASTTHDLIYPAYSTFRYIESGSFTKPTISNSELHYVSFSLAEADGQVSATEQIVQPNFHRYRTNFWEAKIGLENSANIFYLSQRGDYGSESNNVLRLLVNESALATSNTSTFEQIFSVNRVYGYAIDRDNRGRYPGDFELATLDGQPTLLVNSFRDLIYFASAPFYSVTRKLLDGADVEHVVPSSADSADFNASYYQLAVIPATGKVLTSSFYGNVLYLFDARPSISIKDQTPTRIE
ncbi:MAG: hypothetical protein H7318_16285 [Oligoflexus sp.]|nr:hypothetical protein [Oligoflexus sp.]